MTCSTSKISRLETGKGIPKLPDVKELIRIYGVLADGEGETLMRLVHDAREQGWWESFTEGVQPERFVMDAPTRYAALETEAIAVRSFEVALLPGLLQTPDYTRAVMNALLLSTRDAQEIDRLVDLRRRRQLALTDRDPRLELAVVLDEGVLQRATGSHRVMADQLKSILDLVAMPTISVQVLPFVAGLHRAHAGSFVVLEFPSGVGADVVYIEGHAGDTYLEGVSDVHLYKDVLADVATRALGPRESRELIARYQEDHASQ